jgi:hypothetical protein
MYPTAIDKELATEFAEEREEDLGEKVRIVLAPARASQWRKQDLDRVPGTWVSALAAGTADEALAAIGWDSLAGIVPRTLDQLRARLAGLGVLLSRSEPPSLLYFFVVDDEVIAYEGLLPAIGVSGASGPSVPADLTAVQAIHDGWTDFFGGDTGWLPRTEWREIGAKHADGRTLIGVSAKGSALVGFEPGEPGFPTRVLWPDDGRVESPASLFETIDEWNEEALSEADEQRP